MGMHLYTGGTPVATTTTTLASQGGLLINIDSATGDTPITTTGFVEDEKYGLYAFRELANVSAEIDTAVTRTGTRTAKISNTNAAGKSHIFLGTGTSPVATTTASRSKYGIPIKASTKYKLGCWVKTNNAAASSVYISFASYTDAGVRTLNVSTKLTGTNDWTYLTVTATTGASDTTGMIGFSQDVAGNISDAWFDINSMTLEEVIEPVANSLVTPSPSLVSFTAVGSTDNIDASSSATGTGGVNLGNGTISIVSFPFLASKSKLTGVQIAKRGNAGTFVGNVTVSIQADSAGFPTGTSLASYTIPNATWNALTGSLLTTVNLPCNLTTGNKYHICVSASTSDAVNYTRLDIHATTYISSSYQANTYTGSWAASAGTYGRFVTLYYKPTTNFKASQNNSTVSISADEDGFAEGAVINLLTGAYVWGLGVSATDLLTSSSIYSATAGPGTAVGTQTILNNYGFFTYAGYNWIGTNSTANTLDIIWKFTTTRPITGDVVVTFRAIERTTGTTTVAYSTDNSSYTTAGTLTNSANSEVNYSYTISGLTGETDFFIRFRRAGTASKLDFANLAVSTTVNTASINGVLKNYPTNKDIIKQYATTLGSATTSATYRATKWGFPAIEYSSIIDQSQLTSGANQGLGTITEQKLAQPFTPTKSILTGVVIRKSTSIGVFAGTITASIVNDTAGSPGTTTYATYDYSAATWDALANNTDFTIPLQCPLTAGTPYWIQLSCSTADNSNYAIVRIINGSGGQKAWNGATWSAAMSRAYYFKTLYDAVEYLDVDTTATGSTVAFSELGVSFTTVADGASLAISSTSSPSIWVKTNITANRIYSSSNDANAISDKDGSLKQTITYQIKPNPQIAPGTMNSNIKFKYG